jgi:Secretion system C-terminal sorting domain
MKKIYLFTALITCLLFEYTFVRNEARGAAVIVINEILPGTTVELKNIGDAAQNVSSYYLCDFPAYQQIGTSNIIFGNVMMQPGDILVINNVFSMSANDGELGLYATPSYSSSAAIRDYVEWGSTGHTRSTVAVAAGIWTTGDFVPAFTAGSSIEYDGSGNSSTDWAQQASPTIGAENGGGGCLAFGGAIAGGPFGFCTSGNDITFIADGEIALTGNSGTNSQWILTNVTGVILSITSSYSDIGFSGFPAGSYLLWHISYENDLIGATVNSNVSGLEGCFSLSNSIEITVQSPDGGVISGGPFTFCVGNGEDDIIGAGEITLTGNTGVNSQWVVTTESGAIVFVENNYTDFEFDGEDGGTCLLWHISYEDGLANLQSGVNIANVTGCYSLSNSIEIIKNQPQSGTLTGGPYSFCSDGNQDFLAIGDIDLSGNSGTFSQWVITDENGVILALPVDYTSYDFEQTEGSSALIWHLSFETGLTGANVGNNASELAGCFDLSNAAIVTINQPEGGELSGGPFSFCINNNISDFIADGEITLTNNQGSFSQWVITAPDGIIVGLPENYTDFDFETLALTQCQIWSLSYEAGLNGTEIGANVSGITGCFDLSNPLEVTLLSGTNCLPKCDVTAGIISGNNLSFCVGNGVSDNIPDGAIASTGSVGESTLWVVTNQAGTIVFVSENISLLNFDVLEAEIHSVYEITFSGELTGLTVNNALDVVAGCFALSNALPVTLNHTDAGTITGGPFAFCANDGIPDFIGELEIQLEGNSSDEELWLVTDNNGIIISSESDNSTIDFNDYLDGNYLLWHLTHIGPITGTDPGGNANNIEGCSDLSNSLEIAISSGAGCDGLCLAAGGQISGGPFSYCLGDDIMDMIPAESITLNGNAGTLSIWVITDVEGNILAVNTDYSAIDLALLEGDGFYLWNISYEEGLLNAAPGFNASDLEGCFDLSNSIAIENAQPDAAVWSGPAQTFCAGDGEIDSIVLNASNYTTGSGENSTWIVTNGFVITDFQNEISQFSFDTYAPGTYEVWNISYNGALVGVEIGSLLTNISGCLAISNSILVNMLSVDECLNTCTVSGGQISGDPLSFCTGNGVADNIPAGTITLSGNIGSTTKWLLTDGSGVIVAIINTLTSYNFDNATTGIYSLWSITYDEITGLEVSQNVADLVGCFEISNAIQISITRSAGGQIAGTPISVCLNGDGAIAPGSAVLSNNAGETSVWVITTALGVIQYINSNYENMDLSDATPGSSLLWHLSYSGAISGLAVGVNISGIQGCFDFSNSIAVNIYHNTGGTIYNDPFVFCVSDAYPDYINELVVLSGNVGENGQWIVTSNTGVIKYLPTTPNEINFDLESAGTLRLYHISYSGELTNANIEMNIANIGGCYALSNFITVSCIEQGGLCTVNVDETILTDGISFFPNPMSDIITISNTSAADVQIRVLNPIGQVVISKKNIAAFNQQVLDVSGFNTGVYFIEVTHSKSSATYTVLKN